MDPIAIVIGLILLAAATAWVIKPFRTKARLASKQATAVLRPREAHNAALAALRDLDFDFRTGKVSAEDYPALREQLMAETAKYVAAEGEEDARLEALVRARKVNLASQKDCPKCGTRLAGDAQFCSHCGSKLAAISACPSCGKTVQAGDLFCRSCGGKLELRAEVAV